MGHGVEMVRRVRLKYTALEPAILLYEGASCGCCGVCGEHVAVYESGKGGIGDVGSRCEVVCFWDCERGLFLCGHIGIALKGFE